MAKFQRDSVWSLESDNAYLSWKDKKLEQYSQVLNMDPLAIESLSNPSKSETEELLKRIRKTNLAIYSIDDQADDIDCVRKELRAFSDHLGLEIAEKHRSAGEYGIVALQVSEAERQRGYIPYSRKPMNWHTDGYYNAPDEQIKAMVLHCVRPASDGGKNQFFDPEIAYIRLRDRNPEFVDALMNPHAMSIPENREPDGKVRPESVGPVFSVDQNDRLAMRYTARTRSIEWLDNPVVRQAAAELQALLVEGDPLMYTGKLSAGQGVLCNNVLHNRTGFDPDTSTSSDRLVFRVRFHNRVAGS